LLYFEDGSGRDGKGRIKEEFLHCSVDPAWLGFYQLAGSIPGVGCS